MEQLSLKLMSEKVKGDSCGNLLISPLSLSAGLAMLGAGCSESPLLDGLLKFADCKTPEELVSRVSKAMSIIADGTAGEGSPVISFVNGAWIDKSYSFQPEYELLLRDTFKSEGKVVDFANQAREAARVINSWAELHTKGIIKSVITPQQIETNFTEVVLGNALYFKGQWSVPFNSDWTVTGDFHLLDGDRTSKVAFMTKYPTYVRDMFGEFDDFKVFELPYRCELDAKTSFSMQFFLPNKKDGLKNLLKKLSLDPGFLNGGQFKLKKTKMDLVQVPKFKFSYSLDELKFPFMDRGAELSEMLQDIEGVRFAIKVVQKAWIEVDERGTEAVAVYLSQCGGGGVPPPRKEFVADHPFVFTIKENVSGLVLFVGAVLDPPPATETPQKRDRPSS